MCIDEDRLEQLYKKHFSMCTKESQELMIKELKEIMDSEECE